MECAIWYKDIQDNYSDVFTEKGIIITSEKHFHCAYKLLNITKINHNDAGKFELGYIVNKKFINKQNFKQMNYKLLNKVSIKSIKFVKENILQNSSLLKMLNDTLYSMRYDLIRDEYFNIIKHLIKLKSTILSDKETINYILNIEKKYKFRIRNLEDFKKFKSRNRFNQIKELVNHLFVKYPVPKFLYNIWYSETYNENNFKIFFHLTNGKNIRTFKNIPFPLTKKESHTFLQSPDNFEISEAFYYSKIYKYTTDINKIKSFLDTKISEQPKNISFWLSVVQYLVNLPMLDINQYGVVIDYINEIKYVNRVITKNGMRTITSPKKPNFTMKNRNIVRLLEDVELWHNKLKKIQKHNNIWEGFKIGDFKYIVGKDKNKKIYYITQLLSSKELFNEGKILNHCVSSYSNSCKSGRTSIFNMSVEDYLGNVKKILTIEVSKENKIRQIRGYSNRSPYVYEKNVIKKWTSKNKITY